MPSQFLVKRKGLGCNEYGLVDARAAKRQRLLPPSTITAASAASAGATASGGAAAEGDGGVADEATACPVSLQMVEDYEVGRHMFSQCLHDTASCTMPVL